MTNWQSADNVLQQYQIIIIIVPDELVECFCNTETTASVVVVVVVYSVNQ